MATLHPVVLAGVLMVFAPVAFAQSQPAARPQETQQSPRLVAGANERKDLLDRAQKAYSSLAAQGLNGFRCRVQPDFDTRFKTLPAEESQLLPILKKVRFNVEGGGNGAVSVTHQSNGAPPDRQVADHVTQALGGTDQVIEGFLQTWGPFAITAPFAGSNGGLVIEDLGANYRMTQKDELNNIVMLVRHDFAIEQIDLVLPSKNLTIRPHWDVTAKGWRLAGYDGVYTSASGQTQQVSAKVEYQDVEGFQLLRSVDLTVQLSASSSVRLPIAFSEYQIRKR
jgi:hypothetical protein